MGHESAPLASTSAAAAQAQWWVVCLCAQWCGVCREYASAFAELARSWPQVRFEWVDVEDDEEVVGDLDVATFPTLLIADGRRARFLGPVLPQAALAGRMLQSLQDDPEAAGAAGADAIAQALFQRIAASR